MREIKTELMDSLAISVDVSTICKYLSKSGFTRQKLQIKALQQDTFLRQKYILDVSSFSSNTLIFVDETGADTRNFIRKYGYSRHGKPLQSHKMLVRGERVSAIACMSVAGLLDVKMVKGTTDGGEFYDYIQTHLLPHLMPFNGRNPHSVVILDNCTVHHVPEAVKSIEDIGSLILFLPPYSPDFNPIEEAFSKVKSSLKSYENTMQHINDIETLLLMSFAEITPEDCIGWINHPKIYS